MALAAELDAAHLVGTAEVIAVGRNALEEKGISDRHDSTTSFRR